MKISLGTTYYNNPENILKFLNNHYYYFDEVLIVDDGSEDIYNIEKFVVPNKKMRVFKVLKDYGFNSHGCRNLIMDQARNDFVVLLDSDRIIHNIEKLIEYTEKNYIKRDTLYRFTAHSKRIGVNTHISVNDFLISKDHFFSVGGYDEEWIGYRNGDREFFEQLKNTGKDEMIDDINLILTRKPSVKFKKSKDDISTKVSPNDIKKPSDDLIKLVQDRRKKPDKNKKIITFEWEEITYE